MAEYIEREAAKGAVDHAMELTDTEFDIVCDYIDRIPAADVAPVKHGHIVWKEYHKGGIRRRKCLQEIKSVYIEQQMPCKHIAIIDERYLSKDPYCSECGKLLGEFLNYCGNCGAKMDGCESEEESNDNAGGKSNKRSDPMAEYKGCLSREQTLQAWHAQKSGKSIVSVAMSFNVDVSTLYRSYQHYGFQPPIYRKGRKGNG